MASNSCWSTIVKPGVPTKVTYPDGAILNITGLSLDIDPKQLSSVSGKITLTISVNNAKPVTIMSFIVGRYDSSVVNILLGKNDTAVLTSTGANYPVHVSGCLVNYKPGLKAPAAAASKAPASTSKTPSSAKKAQATASKNAPPAKKSAVASKNPTSAAGSKSSATSAAKKTPAASAVKKTPASTAAKKPVAKRPSQKK